MHFDQSNRDIGTVEFRTDLRTLRANVDVFSLETVRSPAPWLGSFGSGCDYCPTQSSCLVAMSCKRTNTIDSTVDTRTKDSSTLKGGSSDLTTRLFQEAPGTP
jgi:hypothetical protein